MEQLIRQASGNISGKTLAVIMFVVIVGAMIFTDKIPTSNKEAKGSTLFGSLGVLFVVMYIICNHN